MHGQRSLRGPASRAKDRMLRAYWKKREGEEEACAPLTVGSPVEKRRRKQIKGREREIG